MKMMFTPEELREWLKDLINCLQDEMNMSDVKIKNKFKQANDEFYRVFGQNVFELLRNKKLNELFKLSEDDPFDGSYYVYRCYTGIVCDVIWG